MFDSDSKSEEERGWKRLDALGSWSDEELTTTAQQINQEREQRHEEFLKQTLTVKPNTPETMSLVRRERRRVMFDDFTNWTDEAFLAPAGVDARKVKAHAKKNTDRRQSDSEEEDESKRNLVHLARGIEMLLCYQSRKELPSVPSGLIAQLAIGNKADSKERREAAEAMTKSRNEN